MWPFKEKQLLYPLVVVLDRRHIRYGQAGVASGVYVNGKKWGNQAKYSIIFMDEKEEVIVDNYPDPERFKEFKNLDDIDKFFGGFIEHVRRKSREDSFGSE